jgi:hypothetical protein
MNTGGTDCFWTGAGLEPLATGDNCGTPTLYYSINGGGFTAGDANGYHFIPGITHVTYKVVDASNHGTTCGFDITVNKLTVSGHITYYNTNNNALSNIWVNLKQGNTYAVDSVKTDGNGYYQFNNVCPGNYDVIARSFKSTTGSVNATDAAQVNYWGTGNNAYPIQKVRFYAGDVVLTNTLNGGDASRILGYFVTNGNPTWTPPKGPWTFWPTNDALINNNLNPPSGLQVSHVSTTAGSVVQDFYGLCTGDFNMSFTPDNSGKSVASESLTLTNEATRYQKTGDVFDLPIYSEGAISTGAVSLILNFPSDKLDILGVTLADDANTPMLYNVLGDELRIGWTSLDELSVKAAGKLLTLKVKLIGSLAKDETVRFELAQDRLNELASSTGVVIPDAMLNIDLVGSYAVGIDPGTASAALTFTNYPNPFIGTTTLAYTLPVNGEVTIEIHDMLGVTIKAVLDKVTQNAGDHKLVLDGNELPNGVYIATLKLTTQEGKPLTRTIKIVRTF